MWNRYRLFVSFLVASCGAELCACSAHAPVKPPVSAAQLAEVTAVPTVPPETPTTPVAEATPLPTRPIGAKIKHRKGEEAIGPVVTFFGAARADGTSVDPVSVGKDGVPTYRLAGSGFMIVVEAKPGNSGYEPGRQVFMHVPGDPKGRPDLEIETTRDMGNGSPEVCDRQRPNIGGIPGINPPSFAEQQRITDAINDFGCRFETFIQSDSACTLDKTGDYAFVDQRTTTQFCMIVARAYAFPVGTTVLSVRVRDSEGNPGPIKQIQILRPSEPVKKP